MPLTDLEIRNFQPGPKAYKKADGLGLFIEVMPNGSKLWRWKYRIHGTEKRLSMGRYPEVSLADARAARDNARTRLTAGRDPSIERKREKLLAAQSAATTFKLIADEYIAEKMVGEDRAEATVIKARWMISLLHPLHDLPIAEIGPPEMLEALKRISATGRYETARKTRSLCSRIFRYAAATLRAQSDPTALLKDALRKPRVIHRAAIIEPEMVGELLRAIDNYEGHAITCSAMKLLPHLMARPGELRLAEWSEFDLEKAVWKIPAERMKMRREHQVPLSTQALQILRDLHHLTGPKGYVFPSFYTWKRPMSENTMNQVLRRMGFGKEEMTAHGWRTTASTLLNESNLFSPDAIERSLAHRDRDAIRGTYARGQYWDERVRMHQWWSDHLDQLRRGGGEGSLDHGAMASDTATSESKVIDFRAMQAKRNA
jgi:integrase